MSQSHTIKVDEAFVEQSFLWGKGASSVFLNFQALLRGHYLKKTLKKLIKGKIGLL